MRFGSARRRARRNALGALLLAVLLPALAPALPAGAPLGAAVARAADGLDIGTEASYVVVPADGVVRVTIDVTARNTTPDRVSGGVRTQYYFERIGLSIQDEARRVRASAGGSALTVTVDDRGDFRVAAVRLRRSLFYRQTTTFRLQYDLPGGAPRSSSDIRVGAAFATFYAWAFGDHGTVHVEVPPRFDVTHEVEGGTIEESRGSDGTTLDARIPDPLGFYVWVTAANRDALTTERVPLEGGEQVIVRGWPEDRAWRSEVSTLLETGVPALEDLIGLPWPVDGPLVVFEVHTPLLEGYAGFYDLAEDEITISEDLDDLTIVHEASHAWFNDQLFTDRWIYEGLADEYASLVLEQRGGRHEGPKAVSATQKAAFPLIEWGQPAPIRDDEAEARETYGYDAAWTVMHSLATSAGEAGMRAVFRAAQDRTIAYVGAGAPERDNRITGWRRFLDLLEEEGGVQGADILFRTWIVDDAGRRELDERADARAAYAKLVAAGDGWAPPLAVRLPMAAWRYPEARAAIASATLILARRGTIEDEARANGLTPPAGLEAAYEAAKVGFDEATNVANREQETLDRVVHAGDAVAAPRDWLSSLGIDGTQPEDALAAARTAWQAGDFDEAARQADAAAALVAAAPDAGRGRAIAVGAGAALLVVVVAGAVLVVRRRRRVTADAGGRPVAEGQLAVEPPALAEEPRPGDR